MLRNSDILDLVSNILDKVIIHQQTGAETMMSLQISVDNALEILKELKNHIKIDIKHQSDMDNAELYGKLQILEENLQKHIDGRFNLLSGRQDASDKKIKDIATTISKPWKTLAFTFGIVATVAGAIGAVAAVIAQIMH